MDHLLPLIQPRSEPMTVPYYGGVFDDRDWADFPTRQGWNLDLFTNGDLDDRPVYYLNTFLQAWLYLGLLSQLMRHDFQTTLTWFTSPCGDHSARRINTTRLPEILAYLNSITDQDERVKLERLVEEATHKYGMLFESTHLSIGLRLSLELLLEALSGPLRVNWTSSEQTRIWLQEEYIKLGICPSTARLDNPMGMSGKYLRSLLGPSNSRYRHDRCDSRVCIAHTVIPELYQPRPAENCPKSLYCCKGIDQGCRLIAPDETAIDDILIAGSFPIVRIERTGDRLAFLVEPFQAGLKYIAISHVVADGLGNFHSNALPECRTREMDQLLAPLLQVEGLEGEGNEAQSIRFWIDTLCVPIRGNALRKAALKVMKRSYNEAYATLILDDGLKNTTPRTHLEQGLAVMTSGWASRLWTIQEVIFSQRQFVQFLGHFCDLADLVMDLGDLQRKGFEWCKAVLRTKWTLTSWTSWKGQGMIWDLSVAKQYTFLLKALNWRTTSDTEDEPFCLASILNIPLERIVECNSNARMREFWLLQKLVPAEVLFLRGPRLTEAGLRWAPSTLMAPMMGSSSTWSEKMGEVTAGGFRCNCPGFRFRSPGVPIQPYAPIPLGNGDEDGFRIMPAIGQPSWLDIQFNRMTSLAVLYPESMPTDGYQAIPWKYVALVNIQTEINGIIEAEYLGVFLMVQDRRRTSEVPSLHFPGQEATAEWLIS